jgi:hypothetical protein
VSNETFDDLDASRLRLFEFPYVGLGLVPIHNSHFCIIHPGKSEFLSINIPITVKFNTIGEIYLDFSS